MSETNLTQSLTVQQAIESRKSVRQFEPTMPKADILEIIRQASLAPSAWNAQPWRIAVVESPEIKEKLQAAAYNQSQVTSAPYVLVVYADMEDVLATAEETSSPQFGEEGKQRQRATFEGAFGARSVQERNTWGAGQAYIAFGFLMLAAKGLGYDSVPMLGFDPAKVKEILGLPEHVQFAGLLPVGKAAQQGYPHHRHNVERIAQFV